MSKQPSRWLQTAYAVLTAIWLTLAIPPSAFAQQPPSPDSLSNQIANLSREVAAQAERIAQLEAEVARLLAAQEAGGLISQGAQPRENPATRAGTRGWMTSSGWDRVRSGMSERQAISILGEPTSRETDFIGWVTIFYRGEVAGSGFVSGNVVLNGDDRVLTVNKPVF